MGIADEVRALRGREAGKASAQAERQAAQAAAKWADTVRALDAAAPEIIEACQQLGIPAKGTMFKRGWQFSLRSVRKLQPQDDRQGYLEVVFFPDGTWRSAEKINDCKKGRSCYKLHRPDDPAGDRRFGFFHWHDFMTEESVRGDAQRQLSQPQSKASYHYH